MSKSGGDGKKAPLRKKRASSGEMQTLNEVTNIANSEATPANEADCLRAQLAAQKLRVQELEEVAGQAVEHLDAVIETVKAIISRQK